MRRDDAIDIIRGIAIFTMVASNLTPYALADGGPEWFRFYGTFAAPLFILLAGMMVKLTERKHAFGYYLLRGVAVMAVGAAVDAYIWGFVPLLNMDVLYLLGLALPLCFLFGRLSRPVQWVVMLAVFIATPWLQEQYPYRDSPDNFMIASGITLPEILAQARIGQNWFIDGWFPVFPWLGVAFAGYLAGGVRLRNRSFASGKVLAAALCCLAGGIVWWQNQPIERFARQGYPDLFYPPTLSFLLVAAGVAMALFYLIDRQVDNPLFLPFKLYGKCSLLLYVLHLAIISKCFLPYREEDLLGFGAFMLMYLTIMAVLLLAAWGINRLKPKKLPQAVRFFIGG